MNNNLKVMFNGKKIKAASALSISGILPKPKLDDKTIAFLASLHGLSPKQQTVAFDYLPERR